LLVTCHSVVSDQKMVGLCFVRFIDVLSVIVVVAVGWLSRFERIA
jgi:hypothetical protein